MQDPIVIIVMALFFAVCTLSLMDLAASAREHLKRTKAPKDDEPWTKDDLQG